MPQKELPPVELLRKLLTYDPETGIFVWNPRGPSDFIGSAGHGAAWKAANWNAQRAGKRAFSLRADGYLAAHFFGAMYRAHRIAWVMHYGEEPSGKIDHINGDRTDNRIANLRVVCDTGNSRNMARSKANTSGVTGVYFDAKGGRWHAFIGVAGKKRHIGSFLTKSSAIEARRNAEKAFGYHPNHGR